jgi:oligoendopeptidase F
LFHEVLLKERMLAAAEDDDARLILLFSTLESSVFNRARWAEFELRIHQEVENGNSLTGEVISEIYLELLRKYYGHDEGICTVADEFGMEWMNDRLIFLRSFGIYRYAVAHTVATVFGERVFAGDPQTVEDYLDYLAAGGSDYPVNLLEKAGVDVTSPGPFQSTMASMEEAMDEIESILDRTGR